VIEKRQPKGVMEEATQCGDFLLAGCTGQRRVFINVLFSCRKERAMRKFAQAVVNFMKREDGPTAVEYAVMLALIIVVCITAITALGTNANKTFNNVSNNLSNVGS
jgi:pilus assembly protein Flp/PilA